jgi:very-short-patch-repair endonuclease
MVDRPTYKENLFKGAPASKFGYARNLRKELTEAEEILWQHLRNRKVNGAKFRRQHPIKHYVLDFYCHEAKLAIEIDGGIHDVKENTSYDENRTAVLKELGINVIRFSNEQVMNNTVAVLDEIGILLG